MDERLDRVPTVPGLRLVRSRPREAWAMDKRRGCYLLRLGGDRPEIEYPEGIGRQALAEDWLAAVVAWWDAARRCHARRHAQARRLAGVVPAWRADDCEGCMSRHVCWADEEG